MDIFLTVWHAVDNYLSTYLTHFLQGINYFFTFRNVLAVFGGVTIGIFCGAIPGMTITMAVALTLPFTFSMEPLTAISLLLAVYVGAIYGGSISAIVLNTPGTPAAACTSLDGFKLSQKGQAGKALKMANWASCVGDLTSTIVVILFLPLLLATWRLRGAALLCAVASLLDRRVASTVLLLVLASYPLLALTAIFFEFNPSTSWFLASLPATALHGAAFVLLARTGRIRWQGTSSWGGTVQSAKYQPWICRATKENC